MKRTTFVILLLFAATRAAAQTPTYVFTAESPGGFVDEDSKIRTHIVELTKKSLSKSKLVTLVDSRNDARIVVEVTHATTEPVVDLLAIAANSISSPRVNHKQDETTMTTFRHATLSVGDYSTDLASVGWKDSNTLAKLVERWVKDNASKLK